MGPSQRTRVVLVGWDAANWGMVNPLLDAGELPNLARLVEGGVSGRLSTHGPLSAAVVYNSVATGKWADKHGVLGDQEVTAAGTVRWTDSRTRRAKAFWNILSQNDRRCHVVHFPGTGPAEAVNGVFAAPGLFRSIPADYRQPFELPDGQLSPAEQTESFKDCIVSLADIDGKTMSLFTPRFSELSQPDDRLTYIAAAVARTLSIHAVATRLMEQPDWDVLSVNYLTIEVLWARFLQYHRPMPEWADPAEADLFGQVAAGAVRLCDLLLGRLLELAGEQAAVMVYSPRGYAPSNELLPPPTGNVNLPPEALYRGEGVFVFRAPGVRSDELIHRIGHLDLCPTVLHLAGVAAGADMDGEILEEAFVQRPARIEPVASWDDAPPLGRSPGDQDQAPLRMQPTGFSTPLAWQTTEQVAADNEWRRVRTLLVSGRSAEALGLLTRLYYTNPLQTARSVMVAEALFLEGMVPETMEVMSHIAEAFPDSPTGQFMGGMVAFHHGETYKALDLFEAACRTNPPFPRLYYYLGQAYSMTDRPAKAIGHYRRSIELADGSLATYVGLSQALYRTGEYEASAEAARRAAALQYTNSLAHFLLARALEAAGQSDQAKEEYLLAVRLSPDNEMAREALAKLGVDAPPKPNAAAEADEPSADARTRADDVHQAVRDARQAVAEWQSEVTEAIASADLKLDDYLKANAAARGRAAPSETVEPTTDEIEWTVRPALPVDQPVIRRMFPEAFAMPHDMSLYVIHPAGTDDVQGGLTIRVRHNGAEVILGVAVRGQAGDDVPGRKAEWLMWRLLRAGVARAAAGGARQVAFTFADNENPAALRRCLERLGFEATSTQTIWRMSMAGFRDRCLGLVERYRLRKSIPPDIRLVTLGDVPFAQADQFLRQFFPDGAGRSARELYAPVSRVMLKGDKIIACFVGFKKDPEVFAVTRLGVLKEHRKLWVTPWLLGDGSKKAFEEGHTVIEFYTDEQRYPEFPKIARGMKADQVGTIFSMALELTTPWPQR